MKVPTSLKAQYSAGLGSDENGGQPATVGHLYGFGSTEEDYSKMVFGLRQRGRRQDGPFNHDTGKGWVKQSEGHYDDAIVTKRTRVTMWLVEALGGAGRGTRAGLRKLDS